jgi:SAM-dependent methyltransferase
MNRHGWEAVGIDMSQSAIETIKRDMGLTAFAGSLPHDELEPASIDLVTMWHSLEHVHDPVRILREARRLLVPSGRLIVAVPDFSGWPRRWFGPAWYGLDLPRHLTHFTPKTLTRMLEHAGFRVQGMRHPRHADWLRNSALLAGRRRAARLAQSPLRFRPIARLASSLCQLARRSDVMIVHATQRA